ncbi:outer membrane lipid asymmetry maintenance protein MlaD [Syntrophobacter fumaroxidans]|uniref:Mammalian cell entry related domain protein n=1 Tax=Syntrophobacter fumaroxidans (strain DSM 10017 / MPOB) TaxID=335543 RepID=A0LFA1_SYNFM|nr:outer membrane lipid asymmetry maintenance protein MlaD [Syntrophobacter fumaroxidans]ABK16103.1 Mammalian cell entry related domain protein [Syntrophobacter fumaroxidans MPOB]
MYRPSLEITVGVFFILGVVCMAYLSLVVGGPGALGEPHYRVNALFNSITGLRRGAAVEIAGVRVGKVLDITLENNQARVVMAIRDGVRLSDDTVASIRTKGIIGEIFVKLIPGGSGRDIGPGDTLIETESAISIEELIGKYMFEKK